MSTKYILFSLTTLYFIIALDITPIYGQIPQIQINNHINEFIIQTVIKNTIKNEVIKREKLTYKRIYTVDNLNDNEQITDREKEEEVLIELGGKERLVKKNGKPVNRGRVPAPRFDLINVLEALAKLDNFTVVNIDIVWGRPHYVINFEPKPGQKANGEIEEVIVRSKGIMYVDIEKFYIKQLSAWLTIPYSAKLGIFNLTRANIEMAQEDIGDVIILKSITIVDRYSLFFSDTFEKQEYLYTNYAYN